MHKKWGNLHKKNEKLPKNWKNCAKNAGRSANLQKKKKCTKMRSTLFPPPACTHSVDSSWFYPQINTWRLWSGWVEEQSLQGSILIKLLYKVMVESVSDIAAVEQTANRPSDNDPPFITTSGFSTNPKIG
jgi:hypothetical protein